MVEFNATFEINSKTFGAEFSSNSLQFGSEFGTVQRIHDRLPEYDGSYEITPLAYEAQTLDTENKTMTADLTVLEIPIYEVSNEYGTTINIGG